MVLSATEQEAAGLSGVRLSTTLKVDDYSGYKFQLAGPDATKPVTGSVLVDGFDVSAGTPISLGVGLHSVVVSGTVGSSAGAEGTNMLRLLWGKAAATDMQPISDAYLFDPRKVEPRGLTAAFRQGGLFNGPAMMSRVDPTVSFYFHLTPLTRPYTGEWSGKLYAPVDGIYKFATEQISHSQLFIDGKQVLANDQSNTMLSEQLNLTKGLHDIRVLYEDAESFSHMYLYWTPPGMQDQYIIPSAFLLPVMGSYPDHPESGSWPSIEEADDTVWSRSAEGGGSGAQGTQQPQPAPTGGAEQPGGTSETPPTPAQAAQPTAIPPTPAGKTAAQLIEPIVALGQSGETVDKPKAVAVDGDGKLYIFTEGDTSIHKFSADGKAEKSWPVKNQDGSPATEISALVVKDGKLLALDAASSEVLNYALDGSGGERRQLCTCFYPRGLALSNDGNFWVADTGGSKVLKVSPDGQTLASIQGNGSEPGHFVEPASLWEAPDGTLYVVDIGNSRVQTFSPDLKPITAWPIGISIARDGNRITGDANGELVTEADSQAVVRYDAHGKELGRWIYEGPPGQLIPSGIAPAGDDKFVVLYPLSSTALLFSPGK